MGKLSKLLVLSVFLVGCELLTGKEDLKPEVPGKILFTMPDNSSDGDYRIYKMNTDGSNLKKLKVIKDNSAYGPIWSPDGQQILFQTSIKSGEQSTSLYLMEADGTNLRPVKTNYVDFPVYDDIPIQGSSVSWSPDGNKIAFTRCLYCEVFGSNSELFFYDFSIDEVIQITDHPGRDYFPQWVSDHTLAFLSNRDYFGSDDHDDKLDLYEVNIESGEIQRMTDSGKAGYFAWNPATEEYLIRSYHKSSPRIVYRLVASTGDSLGVPPFKGIEDLSVFLFNKWSRDGRYLMLVRHDGENSKFFYYDTEMDTLIYSSSLTNHSGYDWHYEKDDQHHF